MAHHDDSHPRGLLASGRLQKTLAFPSFTMPTNLSFLANWTGHDRQSQPPSRPSRPPLARSVASDDSILYHTLSRASSLGDDDRFHHVRDMVNIRLMALKDSLPDVPNFRMPGLAKLQAASRLASTPPSASSPSSPAHDAPSQADADRPDLPAPPSSAAHKADASTPLDRVLEHLTGDIVILGGYRGSVLRSAEPPHHQLWAPVKLGFNMRKANLEVGLDDDDEETMERHIIPSGMLKHIGPIDISRKLFKRLRSCPNARAGSLRVWDYGYDWRLSPALSSRRLGDFLAGLSCNKPDVPPESRGALVIAHSLGGLITRHAVNQRPQLFAGVLYAGVPQRCINILGPLRNGDVVLFNEKLLTAHVNFSIRTSFLLLPDDGFCFVDKETGDEYPVDFFNADDWVKWRLSPCVAPPRRRDGLQTSSSPLSSLFPNALLKGGRSDKKTPEAPDAAMALRLGPGTDAGSAPRLLSPSPPPSAPDRERYMAYLRRTLAATRKFRAQLAHEPAHESCNAYPPHAVLYGKTIPTVYAAQVDGPSSILGPDAYDHLLFRPGDGVVLAREAMLPEGYALVRGGRVSTERSHLTMLGDLPAIGRALEALLRGRGKGIGRGAGDKAEAAT